MSTVLAQRNTLFPLILSREETQFLPSSYSVNVSLSDWDVTAPSSGIPGYILLFLPYLGRLGFGISCSGWNWKNLMNMDIEKRIEELSDQVSSAQASIQDFHIEMKWMRDHVDYLISAVNQLVQQSPVVDKRLDKIDKFTHQIYFGMEARFMGMEAAVRASDKNLKKLSISVANHDDLIGENLSKIDENSDVKIGKCISVMQPVQIIPSSKGKDGTEEVQVNIVSERGYGGEFQRRAG